MERLKNVVPPKDEGQAPKPVPKAAKLSETESKQLSIVTKSLNTKGPQTLPSGKSIDKKKIHKNHDCFVERADTLRDCYQLVLTLC